MVKRFAFLIAATAACGGSSSDLVGRWELHDDETGELAADIEFEEDGGFTFAEYGDGAERNQGTYETDGGLLQMEGTNDEGEPSVAEVTYHADGERLIIGALLPDGPVDGPVGTWTGSVYSEIGGEVDLDIETTYRLSADGTATMQARREAEDPLRFDGTWAEEEDEVVVTFETAGATVNLHMVLIEGAALGSPVYQRAD